MHGHRIGWTVLNVKIIREFSFCIINSICNVFPHWTLPSNPQSLTVATTCTTVGHVGWGWGNGDSDLQPYASRYMPSLSFFDKYTRCSGPLQSPFHQGDLIFKDRNHIGRSCLGHPLPSTVPSMQTSHTTPIRRRRSKC